MRTFIAVAAMVMPALVAVATPDLSVSQPVRASNGYGDVGWANTLGPEGREKVKDAVVVDSYDKVVDALLR